MKSKPINPYAVLAAALIIPGGGHVLLGKAPRGLMFLFFTAVFGWVSLRMMPENASFFARHVGAIFVYGISVLDAYKAARVNWETWKYKASQDEPAAPPEQ